MSLPAVIVRTASFALTTALTWLAYPVLAAVGYLGLLVASAVADLGPGGPLAGPVLVLLAAVAGVVCVGAAVPAAIAVRAVGGLRGVLVGAVVLVFVSVGSTALAWVVFDLAGSALVAAALLVAGASPATLVLALSDAVAGRFARLLRRPQPLVAEA